jgi:DNA-binding ferritin-like protein
MRQTRKRKEMILTGRLPTKKTAGRGLGTKRRSVQKNKLAQTIVPTFLHMLNTVKLYHWKTTSFATHKATDELYGSLNEKIDHFVEVMLGKKELGGRAKLLHVPMMKLDVYSNNDAFTKQIERYKDFLLNMSKETNGFNTLLNTDLLAIRDEILADFNKFLYLLSLGA